MPKQVEKRYPHLSEVQLPIFSNLDGTNGMDIGLGPIVLQTITGRMICNEGAIGISVLYIYSAWRDTIGQLGTIHTTVQTVCMNMYGI